MQSEFFLGVFGFGVLTAGGGVLTAGGGVLTTTGLVAVGTAVGVGVSSFATFWVGETDGDGDGVLLADAVTDGETVGVGVTFSVVPEFA